MNKLKNILFIGVSIIITIISCKKKDDFDNPYDSYSTPPLYSNDQVLDALPSDNFAYLQKKVFAPTCANSGCHDGAFEPDFRTIASSYNTTVYQNVITNDASNTFTYRVKPNDHFGSLLHERLITFLPSTSGIMPLVTNSDWDKNKNSYINSIKTWINNGAKDMYGNLPNEGNPHPIVTGFHAFPDNNTASPYNRASGAGVLPIVIPRSNVDLWFNITDDQTPATSLTVNEVLISEEMYGFEGLVPSVMSTSSTLSANDFQNNNATFTHKLDLDASIYPSGTILFVRLYIQDADHISPLETPNDGSAKQVLYLFSLYVN